MTDKRIISVSFHLGDWQTGTMGMDATEVGAYHSLIMALYARGGEISADDQRLKRIARVRDQRTWKRVRPVVLEKFIIQDGMISHARVNEELSHIRKKSKGASDAAHARWEGQRRAAQNQGSLQSLKAKDDIARTEFETQNSEKPNEINDGEVRAHSAGSANLNPQPFIINNNPNADADLKEESANFAHWYELYPSMMHASRDEARKHWDELTDGQRDHALSAVVTYAKLAGDQNTRHRLSPQRWLRERRFENFARTKVPVVHEAKPMVMPDEGTPERDLFDACKARKVPEHVWNSWLGPDKIVIRGTEVFARNSFCRGQIENKFAVHIKAAGLTLATKTSRDLAPRGALKS